MATSRRTPDTRSDTFLCLDLPSSAGEKSVSRLLKITDEDRREVETYRFENKRAPISPCEGDPAPILALPIEPAAPFRLLADPNGDLTAEEADRSLGELRPVEVPDMGWVVGI